MKIIIFGFPAIGHFNPTVPLVKMLIKLGCNVIYFNRADYKNLIESIGSKFIDYDSYHLLNTSIPGTNISDLDVKTFYTDLHKILTDCACELLEKLLKEDYQADLIIYDQFAIWGQVYAEKYEIKSISSCPMLLDSSERLNDQFAFNPNKDKKYQAHISKLNKFIDLKINSKVLFEYTNCEKSNYVIVYTPKEFQPNLKKVFSSNKFYFLGNRYDKIPKLSKLDFRVQKKIYVSLGTIFNGDLKIINLLVQVLSKNKDFGITLSTGGNDYVYHKLKESNSFPNVNIVNFVDQLEMLSNSSLFITHGGLNSICESIYTAVPMILMPQMNEHKINSEIAVSYGVGYLIDKKNNVQHNITKALDHIHLNWDDYKSKIISLRKVFLNSENSNLISKKLIKYAAN